MTQQTLNPDNDSQFESIRFYEKLVRKHGRKNAREKLQLITSLGSEAFQPENISVYSVPYGDEKCFCSHPIGNVFVVNGNTKVGGDCLGYIMDYLNIPKGHIKDALTLLSRGAKFREFGIGSRKIILTELKKEYQQAKKNFYAQKKDAVTKGKEKMDLFMSGQKTLLKLFPKLSDVEREFLRRFVKDAKFRRYTKQNSFWNRRDLKGQSTTISFLHQIISGKKLSDKQIYCIKRLLNETNNL